MHLHGAYNPALPAEEIFVAQQKLARQYTVTPILPDDRFLCGFTHIFAGGYAAGYYSYKYAEAMSADAYGAFASASPAELPALGRKFRSTVLSLGGSVHPRVVFEQFRGRPLEHRALLASYGLS